MVVVGPPELHPDRRLTIRCLTTLGHGRQEVKETLTALFPACNDAVNLALQYQHAQKQAEEACLFGGSLDWQEKADAYWAAFVETREQSLPPHLQRLNKVVRQMKDACGLLRETLTDSSHTVLNTLSVADVLRIATMTLGVTEAQMERLTALLEERLAYPRRWLNSDTKCLRFMTLLQHLDVLQQPLELLTFWEAQTSGESIFTLETRYDAFTNARDTMVLLQSG